MLTCEFVRIKLKLYQFYLKLPTYEEWKTFCLFILVYKKKEWIVNLINRTRYLGIFGIFIH